MQTPWANTGMFGLRGFPFHKAKYILTYLDKIYKKNADGTFSLKYPTNKGISYALGYSFNSMRI